MQINVTISLAPDEFAGDLAGNATELADQILKAVGADEAKDGCHVQINDAGSAGTAQTPFHVEGKPK